MDNIKLLTINDSNIGDCHTINENNVPNVGTTTFKEFEILVQNSDFHRCVILDNKVLGFLICFKDSCLLYTSPSPRDKTVSRMPSSA